MTRALVLGAGVIGASVALAARAAGWSVRVISERRMSDADATSDPSFASAYPAAAIAPHSVFGETVTEMFLNSERVFGAIEPVFPNAGVGQRRHYELWEEPARTPGYAPVLRNRIDIAELSQERIPRRAGADGLHGYRFDSFFADMDRYRPWLDAMIERAGCLHERRELTPAITRQLDADVIFNCLGFGAPRLFPDLEPGFLLRGVVLVFGTDAPLAERGTGALVSYNYTPTVPIYPAPDGGAGDVYFYPRARSVVFGGLRQPGMIDADTGAFDGAPLRGPLLVRDGVEFPRAMLELNRELVEQLTGVRAADACQPLVGYRYLCGTPDAPQVEIAARRRDGRLFIDCLGFGGAGVTLSWGGAARALAQARLAMEEPGPENPDDVAADEIIPFLRRVSAAA